MTVQTRSGRTDGRGLPPALGAVRLEDLRSFIVLTETLSFREAASRLFVTPGCLSRRIAHLEAAVGTDLVRTTTRSVVVTDHGQVFRVAAQDILRCLDELPRCA